MKILHTSDWHLGQKFWGQSRHEEHKAALNWLLEVIKTEEIEALIVAGDVFDVMNPPNEARTLYYDFLVQLTKTTCQNAVIVGGNHDSPTMLNAPKSILKALNINVVGAATNLIEDEIIPLFGSDGELKLVVAAVPFLRHADVSRSVAGELLAAREERLRHGIRQHYEEVAAAMQHYETWNVPLIATGHLFVTRATDNKERSSTIYAGNLENIDATDFPTLFDYVALGHVHKAQRVEACERIRYSGSLIPLSFQETKDKRRIYILDFEGRNFTKKSLVVPEMRTLKTLRGSAVEVEMELRKLEVLPLPALPTWLEVVVVSDTFLPDLRTKFEALIGKKNAEILQFRVENTAEKPVFEFEAADLKSLTEREVFEKKCESENVSDENKKELLDSFSHLLNLMEEEKG